MKKTLALLAAALIVGAPTAAQASPNQQHPVEEAPYYGPQGPIDMTKAKAEKVAGWGWVIFCGAAAASLLNPMSW